MSYSDHKETYNLILDTWTHSKNYIESLERNRDFIYEIIITTQLASELILNKLNAIKKEMNISLLTDKQISILYLIAKGFTERAIAVEIGISLNTVRYHKKKTFKILGVNNNCEAIIKAIKMNIIDVDNIHL